jgi:hypothetical protein
MRRIGGSMRRLVLGSALVALVVATCTLIGVSQLAAQSVAAASDSPPPSVIAAAVPFYASIAQSASVEGEVVLRVSTDGDSVSSIETLRGPALLADTAKQNIRTWKFRHHKPAVFETTFRYKLLPARSNEKESVVLRLPTEVEVTAMKPLVYEIIDVLPLRSIFSIAELCGWSNVVAEVTAVRHGDARLDPRFRPSQPQPLTPTVVRVERVFKTSGAATVSPGLEMVVLEHYGQVETPSMIGRRRGESAFMLGSAHFVFLECTAEHECMMRGPALRISGQLVTGGLEPEELARGADGLRKTLQACSSADRR